MPTKLLFVIAVFLCFPFSGNSQEVSSREAMDLLVELIQSKPLTGEERRAGLILEQYLREKGFHTHIFTNEEDSYNFTASLYPLDSGKPNYILTGHLDVVSAFDEEWTHPPFEGVIDDTVIWGRGTLDCLGPLAMQAAALTNFKNSLDPDEELPYNFTILALSGEEEGGHKGARIITSEYLDELHAKVIFGEGGSGIYDAIPSRPKTPVFGISIAEKSSLWLKLEASEKKVFGHGAAPPALYANKRMIKGLIKLLDHRNPVVFNKVNRSMFKEFGRLEGGVKGFVIRKINWIIFRPLVAKYFREGAAFEMFVKNTYVITGISNPGPTGINQIPSIASATLDCRLLPGESRKRFIRKIDRITGNKIDVEVISQSPHADPSPILPEFDLFGEAIKTHYPTAEVAPFLFPATTDNNYFRKEGIPVYGNYPTINTEAMINAVHGTNEHIPIKEFENGIKVYTTLLHKLKALPISTDEP